MLHAVSFKQRHDRMCGIIDRIVSEQWVKIVGYWSSNWYRYGESCKVRDESLRRILSAKFIIQAHFLPTLNCNSKLFSYPKQILNHLMNHFRDPLIALKTFIWELSNMKFCLFIFFSTHGWLNNDIIYLSRFMFEHTYLSYHSSLSLFLLKIESKTFRLHTPLSVYWQFYLDFLCSSSFVFADLISLIQDETNTKFPQSHHEKASEQTKLH